MIIVLGFQFLWTIDRYENVKVVFGFALLRTVIGLENLRLFLNQSDAKLKPIATWSPAFSRALGSGLFFSSGFLLDSLDILLSSDWVL